MKVNFAVVALPMRNNYLLFFRAVKKSMGCYATNTGHCQGPVYVPVGFLLEPTWTPLQLVDILTTLRVLFMGSQGEATVC